jgi:hypothetical protein
MTRARDPVRLALIDSMGHQSAVEMIAGALRAAHRRCDSHKFGGASPDTLWRLLNGVWFPRPRGPRA